MTGVQNRNMKRTLYVTDLDGTLMRDDKTISNKSIGIINDLIGQGMLFTCATARSISSAGRIIKDVRLPLPVIVRNGTILADGASGKEIEIILFTQEEAASVRECTKGMAVPGFVTSYTDGKQVKRYVDGITNTGFDHYLADHKNDRRLRSVSAEDELYEGSVCYFTYIGERSQLEPLYERVKECRQCDYVFQKDTYREEYWLEIFPRNATKAKAIEKLKQKYHCDRLVVFGDSLNDISMFQIADESYAVENAAAELKAIATGIIGDNNSDSVAEWLKMHV